MVKNKNFQFLWFAFLVSSIGDWLQKIALPIIVLQRTGSAYQMAGLYGVSFIPWILFTILGGAFADKMNKSKIISYGYFISLLFSIFLIVELQQKNLNLVVLYIASFLLSSVEPMTHPAFQSLIPLTTSKDNLEKANSLFGGIDNTLSLIGPMVAGSLILLISPIYLIWLNAASFLFAGSIALFIKVDYKKTVKKDKLSREILDGVKAAKANKVIWNGAILFLFINFAVNLFQANLAYFITGFLHGNSFDYGLVLSLSGLGALFGVMLAPAVNKKFKAGRIISSSAVLSGLGLGAIFLFRLDNFILIGLLLGLSGFFDNIIVVTYFSLRQRSVEPEILGRVISVTRTISYISIPIGAFLGGAMVGNHISLYIVILLAALIEIGAGCFGYFSSLGKTA